MRRAALLALLSLLLVCLLTDCSSRAPDERVAAPPERGARMTVLHLGDSHTAADHFSGGLRDLFQARYGRGPRGMLPPGRIFTGYRPHQVRLSSRGAWRVTDAWRDPEQGPYGLSGYKVIGERTDAKLVYEAAEADAFTEVRLGVYGRPGSGGLVVDAGEGGRFVIASRSAQAGHALKTVRLTRPVTRLTLSPAGDGTVELLSVALERPGAAGATYVSHGVPGATVRLLERFDESIIARELTVLDPALIVLAFGTNEGFDDSLDGDRYRAVFAEQIERLRRLAPRARIVVAGPPDGNRLPAGAGRPKQRGRSIGCVAEAPEPGAQRAGGAAAWHVPEKLGTVRRIQQQVAAAHGLMFWDWSAVMDGPCGIHGWVNQTPPKAFADHVHMTNAGAGISARSLFGALVAAYGEEWSRSAGGRNERRH